MRPDGRAAAAPADVLEAVAAGLSFPTSLAFGDDGTAFVAESGLPFGGAAPGGRVLAIGPGGEVDVVADGLSPPVTGLTHDRGTLLVSEGSPRGRISRLHLDGRRETILDDLPGPGNYHTNMALAGPDGRIYFSQGAMTNAGIVGLDAFELGWLGRLPHAHDVPGRNLVLAGVVVETEDPLGATPGGVARTGAFAPFGTPTELGDQVAAGLPCTAAVMRCRPDGRELELVAWGLRNAFGLAFLRDGRLLAVDQGADERGSRPVGEAPDLLFEVREGVWYGWPDHRPQRGSPPEPLIVNHEELGPPARALVRFAPHSAATKIAEPPPDADGWDGALAVALFGDERPMTAPAGPRAGRALAAVNLDDGHVLTLVDAPLRRPIDVAFHPRTGRLHVLDFGGFEIDPGRGLVAEPASGALWRT
jgi:glucose/arabinose dehydrogenase